LRIKLHIPPRDNHPHNGSIVNVDCIGQVREGPSKMASRGKLIFAPSSRAAGFAKQARKERLSLA
jgi:hypothetical protein